MSTETEYILGTEDAELARLGEQHQAWVARGFDLWDAAGFRAGDQLLDLGAGPGFTTFDLAQVAGPSGRVVAVDESARYVTHLEAEAARRGLGQVEAVRASVEALELPAGSFDGAYSRWLFSWLEDPGLVVERVAALLRPGGRLACQEYLRWDAMRLTPKGSAHARAVDACMASWTTEIDVAGLLPTLAERAGLRVTLTRPAARVGAPGSLVWRWVEGFFSIYLPKLVTRGLLTADDVAAWRAEWDAAAQVSSTRLLGPVMMDMVFEKPR